VNLNMDCNLQGSVLLLLNGYSLFQTAHLTSSQTEEVIEQIEAETGQSIMSFEDFSDLIRGLPMEPGTEITNVSQGVVENQVFEVPPNITNQPQPVPEGGTVSYESMGVQPVFVLEETPNPEGDTIKSDLTPIVTAEACVEPKTSAAEPTQDAVPVADPPEVSATSTNLPSCAKISESEPSTERTVITVSIDEDEDEDVPVIDISSDTEEAPPLTQTQPQTVAVASNSQTDWPVVTLPDEEDSESKVEEVPKSDVPGAELEEKLEQVPVPLPEPEVVAVSYIN